MVPVAKAAGARGALLYSLRDLGLARVVVRLLQAGVIPQHVLTAFKYRRLEIAAGLVSARSMVLMFDDAGIARVIPLADAPSDAAAVVSLHECGRGIEKAVRSVRRSSDGVWIGWRTIAPSDVEAALA